LPHFDYECQSCGYEFESFHAMSAQPLVDCPRCNQPKLIKLVGAGLSPIIKGTTTPCRGNRCNNILKNKNEFGKHKVNKPFWRDGPVNKKILKNTQKYIRTGEID